MVSPLIQSTRIENRLPVAREGLPFIFFCVAIAIVFFIAGIMSVGILMGIVSLFTIYFFRDPERRSDAPDNAVLTPADGKILAIRSLKDEHNPLREPAIKVSIFMSVFDVHVNRIPIKGRISEIVYNKGKFFSAHLDKASEQNENNRITLDADNGKKIVFVQIAGLIARRIGCWISEQDNVDAGQRYGLIRFGSRLDIYLPSESRITIQPRDRVKAGETIIGYLQ